MESVNRILDKIAIIQYCKVMSFLAEEIERQMTTQNIDQTRLAEKAGVSQGQISKWRNGGQTSISADQMVGLQRALSQNAEDKAALIRAHLRDELFGDSVELVRVEVITGLELKDRPRTRTKGEKAVQFLAELRVQSKDCNDLLIDMARCLGADI